MGWLLPGHRAGAAWPSRPATGLMAAALVAALALAGCAQDPPTAAPTPAGPATGMDAPQWQLRQWWNYTSSSLGGYTYVVVGDGGGDWEVATDHGGLAFFDARSDVSFLGPVRKSDLAGSQGAQRVEYFRFPLADGAEWTTTWDGLAVTVRATAPRPAGGGDGGAGTGFWSFEARRQDGSLFATYELDGGAGWFRRMTFWQDDGQEQFGFELQDAGNDYTGEVKRWAIAPLLRVNITAPAELATFTVADGTTRLGLVHEVECAGTGTYMANLAHESDTGPQGTARFEGSCPASAATNRTLAQPVPGSWGLTIATVSAPPARQALTVEAHALTRTPVP